MNDYDDFPLTELQGLADPEPDQTPEQAERKQTNAVIMHKICEDLQVTPFCLEDRDGVFVRFPVNGHFEISDVCSCRFRAWLADRFYIAQQKESKKADIDGTIWLLEGEAYKNTKRRTFVRVARVDDKLYVDLCNDDHQAVEVDADGWRIIADPPAWFMRFSSMLPLPIPVEGGSLTQLRGFVNLSDDDFTMLIAWMLIAMNPDGPFVHLVISSEQGSGKSTLTTVLKKLIDPDTVPRLSTFKDTDAFFATATSRRVVAMDNQRKVDNDLADALCRLATGGGYSKRMLYTNNDSFNCAVKRPAILNGIALTLCQMDLLDRAYLIKLRSIPREKRRTEAELFEAFDQVYPQIFGALLTALSCAMRERDYHPRPLPRMADGAEFVMQAEQGGGLPWPVGTFATVLDRKECEKRADAIADDPVAPKVIALAEGQGWRGTMEDLRRAIIKNAAEEEWQYLPRNAKGLGVKLEQIKPLLRDAGVVFEKGKSGTRWIHVHRTGIQMPQEAACPVDSEPMADSFDELVSCQEPSNPSSGGDTDETLYF